MLKYTKMSLVPLLICECPHPFCLLLALLEKHVMSFVLFPSFWVFPVASLWCHGPHFPQPWVSCSPDQLSSRVLDKLPSQVVLWPSFCVTLGALDVWVSLLLMMLRGGLGLTSLIHPLPTSFNNIDEHYSERSLLWVHNYGVLILPLLHPLAGMLLKEDSSLNNNLATLKYHSYRKDKCSILSLFKPVFSKMSWFPSNLQRWPMNFFFPGVIINSWIWTYLIYFNPLQMLKLFHLWRGGSCCLGS